jgi:D-alanyl-D-alanine-carboxypeptidase/D-alanyl-D-alanine-endopeptidase
MRRTARSFLPLVALLWLPLVATAQPVPASAPASAPAPAFTDEATLEARLSARLAAAGRGAIVVGLLNGASARFVAVGTVEGETSGRPVDADTLFELGSVSKVFTATLLAEMVERGEVRLEDPIAGYLPPGVRPASAGGMARPITLGDLSSHVSGLPRMPSRFAPRDVLDPYADFDAAALFAEIGALTPPRAPGVGFEYSNLGAGLLGELLGRRLGRPYADAVKARVLDPLALRDTHLDTPPAFATRLATGFDPQGSPTPHWRFDALAGAGGWRSSAKDMVKFLAASISPQAVPLGQAMRVTQTPRADTDIPATRIGLGWLVRQKNGRTLVWHNGHTGGFHTWLGFDQERRLGAVILTSTGLDVDDLGFNLLDPAVPVKTLPPRKLRREVPLSEAALDVVVGDYRIAGGPLLTVRRDGTRLLAQLEGQPALPIVPESPTAFFYRGVDAQIDFVLDAKGRAVRLVLHQNGHDTPAERVAGAP